MSKSYIFKINQQQCSKDSPYWYPHFTYLCPDGTYGRGAIHYGPGGDRHD